MLGSLWVHVPFASHSAMIRRLGITAFAIATLCASAVWADVREVSQRELRAMVANGQGLGLGPILKTVARKTEGEAVDVRVFDDGGLIYSILVMLPNGKMGTVFIDGSSGEIVSPWTNRAKAVQAAAKSSPGQNKSNNGSASKSQGKSSTKGKSSNKSKSSGKSKGKK